MPCPFLGPASVVFCSHQSKRLDAHCVSLLPGRYLFLLDEFVADLSPQEVEALVMPTLEEVRASIDARGTQWMQQALAGNSGECCQVCSNSR